MQYAKHRLWAGIGAFIFLTSWLGASSTAHAEKPRPIIAYYAGYVGKADIDKVPWESITQVNVAFAGINAQNQCAWMDLSGNDQVDTSGTLPQAIAALIAARNHHNPNVKIVLSVGGWSMSYRFSEATSTARTTQELATSCVAMVDALGLDGLDYDWEYPGHLGQKNCPAGAKNPHCVSEDDGVHFTQLLRFSRELLNDANRPLSAAVYANTASRAVAYDYAGMDRYLSFWNIMSYDINAPSWTTQTAFNAPISEAEATLAFFVKNGATPSKLNLGIPLYGYRWRNITSPSVGASPTVSACKPDPMQYSYCSIMDQWGSDPYCSLHTAADGDFYFCSAGKHAGDWISVDSPRVAKIKADFVRSHGYGGAMFWAIPGDTSTYAITQAVAAGLANPK